MELHLLTFPSIFKWETLVNIQWDAVTLGYLRTLGISKLLVHGRFEAGSPWR